MFVTHEVALNISFSAAQARLVNLAHSTGLGDVPGAAKLVRVRFLDPVYRDGAMTLGLRWEAEGVTGGLFPVLDADIKLMPEGGQAARLALSGSYRPPLGHLGARLDKAILNRVAAATVRALLRNIADALTSPAMAAERPPATAARLARRPVIAPETPP